MTVEVRRINGYGDKYLLRDDGVLFRKDADTGKMIKVKPSGEWHRVILYQNGAQWRVSITTLLRRTYWDRPELEADYRSKMRGKK